MAKYALSFTTQGNDLNTYYLAASVLGMVATKNSSSSVYINSSYGFNNATYAKNFQTLIDGVFDAKYWKTAVRQDVRYGQRIKQRNQDGYGSHIRHFYRRHDGLELSLRFELVAQWSHWL